MEWYWKVLKSYSDFSGRARRKEYWMFLLFNTIFLLIALILDNVIGTTLEDSPLGLFYFLYSLAVFIPGLAVSVRRLHDIGKSGWYYLIIFIPLAGPIWFLILVCTDGDPGVNEYGENPKSNALEDSDMTIATASESVGTPGLENSIATSTMSKDSKQKLPNAVGVLVLGISSILLFSTVIFGLVCGIIALVLGKAPMALFKENPERYVNGQMLSAGRTTAIIGIILSVLYVPAVVLVIYLDN